MDELLSRHLKNRDIVFLVDNAETMKSYWGEASFLLETLLLKVEGLDEDGIDLLFTSGKKKVEGRQFHGKLRKVLQSDPFMAAMKSPEAKPIENFHTDIVKPLSEIFGTYLEMAKRSQREKWRKRPPISRKLTLFILTDGMWTGTKRKGDVDELILLFVEKLRNELGDLNQRSFTIQFIQFGNDPEATRHLQDLDNNLKHEGIPDIIDTEHSTGDVMKMLLGSFTAEFDELDDEDEELRNKPLSEDRNQSFDTFLATGESNRYSGLYTDTSATPSSPRSSTSFSPSGLTSGSLGLAFRQGTVRQAFRNIPSKNLPL